MTTYAKYRILLFSLELTDGKFLRVDNLEDGCSAIEAKAVFDEMRRTTDVVEVRYATRPGAGVTSLGGNQASMNNQYSGQS